MPCRSETCQIRNSVFFLHHKTQAWCTYSTRLYLLIGLRLKLIALASTGGKITLWKNGLLVSLMPTVQVREHEEHTRQCNIK